MSSEIDLRLHGGSVLAAALAREAVRRSLPFAHNPDAPGPARLERTGGHLPPAEVLPAADADLPAVLAARTLARLGAAGPGHVGVTVIAPAGGATGPSSAGPVDAIRVPGPAIAEADGLRVTALVLAAQQTRCWLAAFHLEGLDDVRCAALANPTGPRVEVLPPRIAADTARICEYMNDRGGGDDWPELLVLRASAGELLVAFTEGEYARFLVGQLLGAVNR